MNNTTSRYITSLEEAPSHSRRKRPLSTLSECFGDLIAMRPGESIRVALILLLLTLPALIYLLGSLTEVIGDNLSRARAISVFIDPRADAEFEAFTKRLEEYRQIADAQLVFSEQLLISAHAATMIEITPVAGLSEESYLELTSLLGQLPGVELVSWDTETLTRNQQASKRVSVVAAVTYAIAWLLLTAVLWKLILNQVQVHRQTMDIKRQLGATKHQISRPILLKGLLLGTLAGAIGYGFAALGGHLMNQFVDVTNFYVDMSLDILQIFLYFTCVVIIANTAAVTALKSEFRP